MCLSFCQCHCQSAAADDDDDDDDKVANDDVTVWLILKISRMLFSAVTNAQVCCPVFMAYCILACNMLFSSFTISCKQKCSVMFKMHQSRFSLGLSGSSQDASPDPLVGWRGGYSLPIPHPLDAYGASFSALATPHLELGGLAPRI